MRDVFCRALLAYADHPEFVFLTGDLGYRALEPLRDRMGNRFVNAGVAEQNMVSMAAGLAQTGLRPWAYSIAPFLYARPFEQIRNDVCLHDLPAVLVGNGGGYGYGVMGATHHALEDYGVLLTLPHMRVFVPAFDGDVSASVALLMEAKHPAYLRLGYSEQPQGWVVPEYSPWRRLLPGSGATCVVVGPLVGSILAEAARREEADRPDLWLLSELPIVELPTDLLASVERSGHLVVVEEHGAHGGVGQSLAYQLAAMGCSPKRFSHRYALSYPTGRYGSQQFHRRESGLDAAAVLDLC